MKKKKILFFDIETNAIDHWPTLGGLEDFHCISIFDPVTREMRSYKFNDCENTHKSL